MTPTTRALLLLLTSLLVACGSDDDPPPRSSTTTTTLTAEAEVEAAYLAYWEMVERVSSSPDVDDPEIAARAVDPARARVTESVSRYVAEGNALRFGPQHGHDVGEVSVDGNDASLRDCLVDDAAVVDADSGDVIAERVVTTSLDVVLVRVDANWLVKEVNQDANWDGAVPCTE